MRIPFTQIPSEEIPIQDWRPLAILAVEPFEFADRFGVEFEEDHDDLDYFVFAALSLRSGKKLFLKRYKNDRIPGISIEVSKIELGPETLHEFLETFGLLDTDITWRSPLVTGP